MRKVNESFLGSLLTNGSMFSSLQINTAARAVLEIFPKGFYSLFNLFSIVYVPTAKVISTSVLCI